MKPEWINHKQNSGVKLSLKEQKLSDLTTTIVFESGHETWVNKPQIRQWSETVSTNILIFFQQHPKSNECTQCQISVSNAILQSRTQGSLEQWLILELKQKIYRISLGHFAVLESKKRLKKTNKNTYIHNDEGMSRDTGTNLKNSQWPKLDSLDCKKNK